MGAHLLVRKPSNRLQAPFQDTQGNLLFAHVRPAGLGVASAAFVDLLQDKGLVAAICHVPNVHDDFGAGEGSFGLQVCAQNIKQNGRAYA